MNALYIVFRFCSVVRMSLCQNRCHLADTDPPWYSIYGGFLPAKDASLKMSLACCGSVLLKSHAVAEYNWRFFAMADPCSSWLHILSLMVTSSQILREAMKMGQAWESSVSDRWSGCFWVFADFPVVCLGVGEERNLCSMRCLGKKNTISNNAIFKGSFVETKGHLNRRVLYNSLTCKVNN